MNKHEILSLLNQTLSELTHLAETISESPSMKAEGTLITKTQLGKVRLYHRLPDSSSRYLGEDDRDEIQLLASKAYALKLGRVARKERRQIEKCIQVLESEKDRKGNDAADIDLVYGLLPPHIKANCNPDNVTDDGYAQAWQDKKDYGKRWTKKEDKLFETPRGEKVRSKSEWIIASMLAEAGVPYRYEEIVALNSDVRVFLHPDFTVLNKRTRKVYYWEHFGRMDDQDYVNNSFIPKIEEYYNFNFMPGDKLLMTFESGARPLDTRQIQRVIENFLL